ncbi:MAG: polyprenyl synthetase family protein [Acidobacteria bacterium]|nr:polyprenyl synthetase family protein [Acidobacteriota bacterium]
MTGIAVQTLESYLADKRALVDRALDDFLPPAETPPSVIHEAMRYTVMAGGKRIRPILAVAAAEACGGVVEPLLRHFAALELIHTYSLVHDDLPALDNDDLRRGRKTAHVVYGEAMAILAGDALLTEAFSWLAAPVPLDPRRQLLAIKTVAIAVDSKGMIGGQVADIESERSQGRSDDRAKLAARLEFIHRNKTGRLLTASVLLGGILGGASDAQLDALREYGEAAGLAFQIVDDLLDLEETAETLGKTAGKDLAQGKLTYPSLHGVDAAREQVAALLEMARAAADRVGSGPSHLVAIADFICRRRS